MQTDPISSEAPRVAIIGSFRRHWERVVAALNDFTAAGVPVVAPARGVSIVEPSADYVVFDTDPPKAVPHEIQDRALERILSADLVYVVAPGGYIGATTMLELGHVRERRIPVFFSEQPGDLPVELKPASVIDAGALGRRIREDAPGALADGHLMPAPGSLGPLAEQPILGRSR